MVSMRYIGIAKDSKALAHYGRQGMKWGQHIFGDDPRWGRNGRGREKAYSHMGEIVKTSEGDYDTEKTGSNWKSPKDDIAREAYYRMRDKRLPLSKLKKSTDHLSKPPTLDEAKNLVDKINPHRNDPDAAQKGYKSNCVKCSMCVIMRLKGYDAEAYAQENGIGHPTLPEDPYFSERNAINIKQTKSTVCQFAKSSSPTKYMKSKWQASKQMREYESASNRINNSLKDGDYGYISSCNSKTGNGHNSNFIKINGKTYAIDGQIARVEPLEDYFDDVGWCFDKHQLVLCTGADLNENGVGRFVNESKFKK